MSRESRAYLRLVEYLASPVRAGTSPESFGSAKSVMVVDIVRCTELMCEAVRDALRTREVIDDVSTTREEVVNGVIVNTRCEVDCEVVDGVDSEVGEATRR